MVKIVPIERFVHFLRLSRLLDERQVDRYCANNTSSADTLHFAAGMVKAGLLTKYQAQSLVLGKYRGFRLGRYRVLKPLGKGGTCAVLLTDDPSTGFRFAIKVLSAKNSADRVIRERFYREARVSMAVDHPNMIRGYATGVEGPYHFLVMEYIDGKDLAAILKERGPLPIHEAVRYAVQTATGLAYAQKIGMIHRDIKPANLLVDRTGRVKILDMGLARYTNRREDDLTKELDDGSVFCTPDYAAPEMTTEGATVDTRSDIYSLGCTLHTLLTGHTPFHGTMTQKLVSHRHTTASPTHHLRTDVPMQLSEVIGRMMAKQPQDRFQTPEQVVRALEPWQSQEEAPLALPSATTIADFALEETQPPLVIDEVVLPLMTPMPNVGLQVPSVHRVVPVRSRGYVAFLMAAMMLGVLVAWLLK